MKVAFWTNTASPHQLPLAEEIARMVGEGNYIYLYRDEMSEERKNLGWGGVKVPDWCRRGTEDDPALMEADLVYTGGLRAIGLFERRIAAGKKTVYLTERWFKPWHGLPGKWRMLAPRYRLMAKRMVKLLNNPLCRVYAVGPWAKSDMRWLGVEEGRIESWGYFVGGVSEGEMPSHAGWSGDSLRVLWAGRMMGLKHVDTIIEAIRDVGADGYDGITLTLVGEGPKRKALMREAEGLPVTFWESAPIGKIRSFMREHDVYVLASDENEGWGAVVNEALTEGMYVIGTYEAGASAAMLKEEDLFHAGDYERLAELLKRCAKAKAKGELKGQGIGEWTPRRAAEKLLGELREEAI